MSDIYHLNDPDKCFGKSYPRGKPECFETYNSHINVCLSFVEPVHNILRCKIPKEDIREIARLHDIGKLGNEFQDALRKGSKQHIRHEELAFIKWLDESEAIRHLTEPQILAILAHHRTLIDDDSAIMIEQFIASHENWEQLSRRWLKIIRRPRANRIDTELFLPALPLIDILRTIDVLASFTTQCIYQREICQEEPPESLFSASYSSFAMELSSVNLKHNQINYDVLERDGTDYVKVNITSPIEAEIEYKSREMVENETDIS